jgi:hypothetical protein
MKTKRFPSENLSIRLEEQQRRLESLAEQQQAATEAEKRRSKELHRMHCPKCGAQLSAEQCGPVEIDVCPSCQGVWLDATELASIVASASHGRFFRSCQLFRGG